MDSDVTKKKRILIFSLAYFPYVGGAEVAIKEITNRLPHYEFDLITLRFNSHLPRVEKIENITVHRIGFGKKNPTANEMVSFPLYVNKILFPVTAFVKAIQLHRDKKFDMLWPMLLYAALPAYFFTFFRSVPYVLTIQDGDTPEYLTHRARIRFFAPFLKKAVARATCVQAISQYLVDFSKMVGARKVALIPNGVAMDVFSAQIDSNEKIEIRRRFNLGEEGHLILSLSRLVEKNGLEDLTSALRYLPPTAKVIIAGDGPLKEGLVSYAQKNNLSERLILLGARDTVETAQLLSIANVFVRPSLSEGQGIAFLEAMAAKVPVIATPVGGIPDFLKDKETGWLCNVRDPKSIAEKILYIVDEKNKEEVERVIARARALIEEKYQWNDIAQKMNDLFAAVINTK